MEYATRGMVASQRPFRMPAKNAVKREQPEEERPKQNQQETERYLLQIDRLAPSLVKNAPPGNWKVGFVPTTMAYQSIIS
jgi:hypothetical protein